MISADDFDLGAYTTIPHLDVPSQIALGRQLLTAAPRELPPHAETCKRRLLTTTRELEEGYEVAQEDGPGPLRRPVDQGADNTWISLKSRLDPYTWLDEERFPDAGLAKAISRRLFPTGLSFIQLEYGAQWAEASWRMRRIADEGLEPELRRLCGDVFVDELQHWHKEYGKMVGAVAARRRPDSKARPRPNLAELRRQAVQAAVAWQVQLVALHLAGHPDARAALAPTDDYRTKLAAGSKPAPAPAPVPTDPTPSPSPSQPGLPG